MDNLGAAILIGLPAGILLFLPIGAYLLRWRAQARALLRLFQSGDGSFIDQLPSLFPDEAAGYRKTGFWWVTELPAEKMPQIASSGEPFRGRGAEAAYIRDGRIIQAYMFRFDNAPDDIPEGCPLWEGSKLHCNELRQDSTPQSRLALERLVFFSDAVFAIAVTILVLDIRLPTSADGASSRELLLSLAGLWQEYLAFFISFWVIGLCWISHHRKFLYIQRVDNQLLTLNLLMLMMIAFIPFPTAVMSENVTFTATGFYALTMILACLSGLILWWNATRNHRLVDPNLDRRQIRREASVPPATIAIFMLSMGVAVLDAGLARICWMLVFPVAFFLRRKAA